MAGLSKRTKILLLLHRRSRKQKHTKSIWVRKIFQERKQKGEFHLLINELRIHDHVYFFKYFRMSPTKYEELLQLVGPYITKSSQKREAIGPSERLSVALRYLTTGDAQLTIAQSFRISPTSVGRIIDETCAVIWDVLLHHEFIKPPQTEEEWREIAHSFEEKWNFHHCIGALDGKHINMQAPANSGSLFFNYKKFFSIVLMAICNANYEFILLDIGDTGRNSDGGVFANCVMGNAILQNNLNIPDPDKTGTSNSTFPYVFVADDAFPLKENIMKPFPREIIQIEERIYNYRLSRVRRIIENTFGILAARFRIFRRCIIARESVVINVTKATVALHNYLMKGRFESTNCSYCPPNFVDRDTPNGIAGGDWRNEVHGYAGISHLNRQVGSNNYTRDAKQIRLRFRDFFNSPEGQVPWQNEMVTSTD